MCIVAASLFQGDWFHSQQTTDETLGFYWLKHFIDNIGLKNDGSTPWVILLMDGHSSHKSDAFTIMCEEYHYMQPADVKCFNKVKGWHSKAVRQSDNIVSFM
ncbi:hypothetical protein IFR05_015644 [Cadophora sp. M221]|nr:hypothetical protein IFR05_015644 [Cadophora sp. M221]